MTHNVTTKITKTKLSALTLSVVAGMATLGAPTLAAAQNYNATQYERCKADDQQAQVVGGLIGGVLGAVVGSQVSGNGARTEGSVLGAVIGGAAGAGIGDSQRKCRTEAGYIVDSRPVANHDYSTRGYTSGGYAPAPTTYRGHNGYSNPVVTVGHSNRGFGHQGYSRSGYGHQDFGHQGYVQPAPRYVDRSDLRLQRVNARIDFLRDERKRLERNRYHNGHRYTEQRLRDIGFELDQLKDRKRDIKRRH